MKNTQSQIKPIKVWKRPGATFCFRCKDFTYSSRSQEVKMTNKVLREKSNCVVCWSNKSRFLKQKHNNKIWFNSLFTKNNMKIYCAKCRKGIENIDLKKSRFVKEQEAKCLLSNLGIKTLLSKIPLLNVLL